MSTKRQQLFGLAAAAGVYLVAAAVTIGIGSHPLRPLYEGIGPSSPYRWVHPPNAFKSTNSVPFAGTQRFDLTSEQADVFGAGTFDGQLVLSIPAGAIPPASSENAVDITIAPKDPAKLGPLPVGAYSDGNAYLVSAIYQPSKAKIAVSLKPIDVVLRTPLSSTALLFSIDGRSWTAVPDHHIPGQTAVAATVTSFGYLVAASNVPVVTGGSRHGNGLLLLIVLGLAAVFSLSISVLWRRGRGRASGQTSA